MPWCEDCSRFLSPNTLRQDGSCPSCGRRVATRTEAPPARVPWHFTLLVVAVVVYLGWRAWQLIAWLL